MHKIDLDITKIRQRIVDTIRCVEFQELMTFNIHNKIYSHKDIRGQGVYLFEIKCSNLDELTGLKNIWKSSSKISNIRNIPKFIGSRFDHWSSNGISQPMWIPLYVGKSKDLFKRIDEHINLKPNSSTYSMKLRAWPQLGNYTFKCSIIKLELENYDWIASDIEQFIRNEYKPIIGKQ